MFYIKKFFYKCCGQDYFPLCKKISCLLEKLPCFIWENFFWVKIF